MWKAEPEWPPVPDAPEPPAADVPDAAEPEEAAELPELEEAPVPEEAAFELLAPPVACPVADEDAPPAVPVPCPLAVPDPEEPVCCAAAEGADCPLPDAAAPLLPESTPTTAPCSAAADAEAALDEAAEPPLPPPLLPPPSGTVAALDAMPRGMSQSWIRRTLDKPACTCAVSWPAPNPATPSKMGTATASKTEPPDGVSIADFTAAIDPAGLQGVRYGKVVVITNRNSLWYADETPV